MQLTKTQKLQFAEQGWLKLEGVVPPAMVNAARHAINANLGREGMHPDRLTEFRAQSYCRELNRDPVILDLYNATPIRPLCESAIGANKVQPVGYGQIALRFPNAADPRPPGAHLDGMYSPTNGVPEGEIHNFTALLGVFLSDLPDEFAGNFAVWPGTHKKYEAYFREHGPQSLLQGMPPIEMPAPIQFTGRMGDAALVHYQIAHGITVNTSPNVRYAVFFRLNYVDHEQNKWESMTDIWLEWEGIRAALEESAR